VPLQDECGRKLEADMLERTRVLGLASLSLFFAGLGASFIDLGLAFGSTLVEAARSAGAGEWNASNVIWMPLMLAGQSQT
jgi:ABC-type spermidine/putrescine transport system permease subunit II